MNKKIDEAVSNAVSNVECETSEVPLETQDTIKDYLKGLSKKSEESFLYQLYNESIKEHEEEQKYARKK